MTCVCLVFIPSANKNKNGVWAAFSQFIASFDHREDASFDSAQEPCVSTDCDVIYHGGFLFIR